MKQNNIIALLPMKKNSERVKNKNIRIFAGKPLYTYILDTLINCTYISKIVINTDSEVIFNNTRNMSKVVVHERPKEICGASIPMNSIIDYDINHIDGDYFLQTHSTNPLLSLSTINIAIEKFFKNIPKYDSLLSVTKIQQRFYNSSFRPINHNPMILVNTQELEPIYAENSCIYLFKKESFNINKNRIGKKPYFFEMNQEESYDIDTEDDFNIAEKIYIAKSMTEK